MYVADERSRFDEAEVSLGSKNNAVFTFMLYNDIIPNFVLHNLNNLGFRLLRMSKEHRDFTASNSSSIP